ncbi:hypothetical protein [Prochlorococcus marinus]|uniref:hypothetical protein n=1 Tax=Prochlorococcus marinus TaxID=1219 RepID=UPI0035A32CA2
MENFGIRTIAYQGIKEELSELQKEIGCPDSFIYEFNGNIQNECNPKSFHSLVRKKNIVKD